jgi:hypothetical protein
LRLAAFGRDMRGGKLRPPPAGRFGGNIVMPRLSLAFFSAGAVFGLAGMGWGVFMGAKEDFTLAPAHAHLNLLGWVALSLMGAFYALAGDRAPRRLGWINFALSSVGVLITIPALAKFLTGDRTALPFMEAGESIVILGMASFLAAILSLWAAPRAAGASVSEGLRAPAE